MGRTAREAVLKDQPCSGALWPPGSPAVSRGNRHCPGSAALLTPTSAPCGPCPRARSQVCSQAAEGCTCHGHPAPWARGPVPSPQLQPLFSWGRMVMLGRAGRDGGGCAEASRGAVQALLVRRLHVSRQPQSPSLSSRSQPRAAVSTRTRGPAQCPVEARLRPHELTHSRSFPNCVAWWRACAVTNRGLSWDGPAWCLPAVRASGP